MRTRKSINMMDFYFTPCYKSALPLRQIINLFDDVEQCLGAAGFVANRFGNLVGWVYQTLVVCRADQKQIGVELLIWANIELIHQWAQLFDRRLLNAIERLATGRRLRWLLLRGHDWHGRAHIARHTRE